jgi:class 3 adenylate cyclase/tetratricopeptide (TPR) repeat protein
VFCGSCGRENAADAVYCAACGAQLSSAEDREERKVVSVLFADLVGSTALADAAGDPERTRSLLERFYAAMADEVERAGGTVEKFVGDAVMAVFGVPVALEDHAERALHAALAMRLRLSGLFGERVGLRIGVNTGEVVAGRSWAGGSFVSGDVVNVAARLEQTAETGEILVGERTVALARGAFEFGDARPVAAKGKPEPVVALPLLRGLSLMRPRSGGALARSFVGREEELAQLLAVYRQTVDHARPAVASVVGEPGIGKTRLLRELWERLGSEPVVPQRRVGRCLPYGRGVTYWPLGEVLREHLALDGEEPAEQVLAQLDGREILGRALGLDVLGELHPLLARDLFREAWVGFIQEALEQGPLVVLIEDVHWAEEPLLELLGQLVRDLEGPLLLALTGRPEAVDQRFVLGSGRVDSTVVWLEPLPPAETETLILRALRSELPRELLELVIDRTEGNPFFAEELLQSLIDQGVLESVDGRWAARTRTLQLSEAVPDSVQALLAARIDLLEPAEKAALQAAAVIGRTFWTRPLYELLDGTEPDLHVLEERDFIRRRPGSSRPGDVEYVIKHSLTREVAYVSLTKTRRAQLHARVAEWLEQAGGGRDEDSALLAHHYYEAVRPEEAGTAWEQDPAHRQVLERKAAKALTRASELALHRYEIDDAIDLLERAVEIEHSQEQRAELLYKLAIANMLGYRAEAFTNAVEDAIRASAVPTDKAAAYALLASALVTRPLMWGKRPEHQMVTDTVDRLLELAEPNSPDRTRGLVARAVYAGDEDAAVTATELAERLDDPSSLSLAYFARGIRAAAAGRLVEAADWRLRQLQLLPRIADPDNRSLIYMEAIAAQIALGRLAEARRLAAENEECTAPLTAHHHVHGLGHTLLVEHMADDWQTIHDLIPHAERTVAANDTPCGFNALSLLTCAITEAHLRNDAESIRLEEAAWAATIDGLEDELIAYRIWLELARGDHAKLELLLATEESMSSAGFAVIERPVARLDALLALERWDKIKDEAPSLLIPNTYLQPFAQRALGAALTDDALLQAASERFLAIGLNGQAEKTTMLLTPST